MYSSHRSVKCRLMRSKIIMGTALMILLGLMGSGCDKNPADSDGRSLNTSEYFSQAFYWDSNIGRYIFHSWKEAGTGGCVILINVHDAASEVPPDFNRAFAREAVTNGRNIWKAAIREAGVGCETYTCFASDHNGLWSSYPRIDIYFDTLKSVRGIIGISRDEQSRKFTLAHMTITTSYIRKGKLVLMSHDDYMTTLAHELGHAFGIYGFRSAQGHSSDQNDIMYSPSEYWTLSKGDKATIKRVYTSDAYYGPAALSQSSAQNCGVPAAAVAD